MAQDMRANSGRHPVQRRSRMLCAFMVQDDSYPRFRRAHRGQGFRSLETCTGYLLHVGSWYWRECHGEAGTSVAHRPAQTGETKSRQPLLREFDIHGRGGCLRADAAVSLMDKL